MYVTRSFCRYSVRLFYRIVYYCYKLCLQQYFVMVYKDVFVTYISFVIANCQNCWCCINI